MVSKGVCILILTLLSLTIIAIIRTKTVVKRCLLKKAVDVKIEKEIAAWADGIPPLINVPPFEKALQIITDIKIRIREINVRWIGAPLILVITEVIGR